MAEIQTSPGRPLLSVVVPTYNREEQLCTTVDYFLTRETYRPFELIVVDQTERHGPATERYLESVASHIRLERPTFKNLQRARNHGLAIAKGEIVVFVDDDVEPWDGFLAAHAAPYADPKVWMVTGPSPEPGGRLVSREQISERQYRDLLDGQLIGLHVDFDFVPCSWGPGCNISVRKSAAALVGGFDEKFLSNAVGDDAEFCNRIRRYGGVIYYSARAALLHVRAGSGGSRTSLGTRYVKMFARDENYFFRSIKEGLASRLRANMRTYRRLVLRRAGPIRLLQLHWAFVVGVLSGLREPLSQFAPPNDRP